MRIAYSFPRTVRGQKPVITEAGSAEGHTTGHDSEPLETWTLRKVYQKYLESLKCGATERWRISVRPSV